MKLQINYFFYLLVALSCRAALADQLPSLDQMRAMLPRLNEQIQSNPKDAQALCMRGFIYQQSGNLENAVADCTSAIAADPSMVNAYNYRSIAYMQLKNYSLALKDDNDVIRLKGDAIPYCNRAALYIALHQYDNAIQDYSKALRLNGSSAQAYDGLAEVAYRTAKYEQAITQCNRALYLDPHMSEALYFRGKSYEALGKKALALKDLENARSAGYRPDEAFVQVK